jgi:hypothetical protein
MHVLQTIYKIHQRRFQPGDALRLFSQHRDRSSIF